MDWADVARRANAARELSHAIDGRSFRLRLPTQEQVRILVLQHGTPGTASDAELAEWLRFGRELLEAALVGWDGVTLADILEGADADPVEWDAAGVPLLLDAQPDWSTELQRVVNEAMVARRERIEAARKN